MGVRRVSSGQGCVGGMRVGMGMRWAWHREGMGTVPISMISKMLIFANFYAGRLAFCFRKILRKHPKPEKHIMFGIFF